MPACAYRWGINITLRLKRFGKDPPVCKASLPQAVTPPAWIICCGLSWLGEHVTAPEEGAAKWLSQQLRHLSSFPSLPAASQKARQGHSRVPALIRGQTNACRLFPNAQNHTRLLARVWVALGVFSSLRGIKEKVTSELPFYFKYLKKCIALEMQHLPINSMIKKSLRKGARNRKTTMCGDGC